MSHDLLSVSTPPATSKRTHSQESRRSGSPCSTTPDLKSSEPLTNVLISKPDIKIPAYLNQQKVQIQKRFQDLEWHQRFRLQHGYIHPETSPFRMDKSDMVINRNRYGNVQPWDPSRVKLKTPIGGSDYINASPISLKGYVSSRSIGPNPTPSSTPENSSSSVALPEIKYIATQGPKDGQFVHFWNMIMQETIGPVGVIVMLTQCYEGIKEKCSQYFPRDLDSPVLVLDVREGELAGAEVPMELGDPFISPQRKSAGTDRLTTDTTIDTNMMDVEKREEPEDPDKGSSPGDVLLEESQETTSTSSQHSGSVTLLSLNMDTQSRCEIRRMRLEIGGETKEIYHYLFNGWPDYGKPEGDERRALLELTRQTRERAQASESSTDGLAVNASVNPRFVHCSAGVGRTGTFIALDWLLSQLEQGNLVPNAAEEDSNTLAYQENSTVNGSGKTETWDKSGSVKEKELTPEARDSFDLIYDTVNRLREQRMMMVMNEIQYSFLYEVLKEAFVEKYSRAPMGVVVEVANVEEQNSKGVPTSVGDAEEDGKTPVSQQEDSLSEAETEIEIDPYQAVAPQGIRAELEGVGAE